MVRAKPNDSTERAAVMPADLDSDTQDIIDLCTMLCAVAASGDAEGCIAGINKTLWTVTDRAEAIRARHFGEAA
jgi:hypothetical protein